MDRMQKQIKVKFGRKYYLLGRRKDGKKVWLEQGSWACEEYDFWDFGYLVIFSEDYKDVKDYYHFDEYFNRYSSAFDEIKDDFDSLVLTEIELLNFIDLMKSFYTLRDLADISWYGYSCMSAGAKGMVDLENHTVRMWALKKQLEIIKAVQKLLCPKEDDSWKEVFDENKFLKEVKPL